MIAGSIARRYAKALLALGVESKKYEQFARELASFAALMTNKDLSTTLANPSYPLSKRKAVVQELLRRLRPDKTVENFILLLTDRNRLDAIDGIVREYQRMVDEHAGRVRATVTTAGKLAPADTSRLKQALEQKTGKKVLLTEEADPELIAGMVTQIGSIVYDGSIRTRLEQMRHSLLEGEQ
mgnify:CR=1 FL=1